MCFYNRSKYGRAEGNQRPSKFHCFLGAKAHVCVLTDCGWDHEEDHEFYRFGVLSVQNFCIIRETMEPGESEDEVGSRPL